MSSLQAQAAGTSSLSRPLQAAEPSQAAGTSSLSRPLQAAEPSSTSSPHEPLQATGKSSTVHVSLQARQSSCALCGNPHSHMSCVNTWKSSSACEFVVEKGITGENLVCRPCRDDIGRVMRDPSYTPRWGKKNSGEECTITGCMENVFSNMAGTEISTVLEKCGLQCKHTTTPIPLCKHHYHLIYKSVQPQQNTNCPTCDMALKHVKSRPCPNPELIEQQLRQGVGFSQHISKHDKVCFSCYKSHLTIIRDSKKNSTDQDLQSILDKIQHRISVVISPTTVNQVNNLAMDKVLLYVGKQLLQRRALLLPTVHSSFTEHCDQLLTQIQPVEEYKPMTAMWVFSNLISELQHHLHYSCSIRKYGTLLYRPGSDLETMLQQTLWKLNRSRSHEDLEDPVPNYREKLLNHLNDLVQNQCRKFLAKSSDFLLNYEKLDLNSTIHEIHPELWEAVCALTRSTSDRKCKSDSKNVAHVKLVRRLFLLCAIFYCTDDRCSLPIHTLITDVIDSQGGSAHLIKILNRLGVCASSDTLSRFIQSKISNLCNGEHPCADLFNSASFAAVSIDNLDFLHSYAKVCQGDHSSSTWHGTTVQAVQPIPSLEPQPAQVSPTSDTASSSINHSRKRLERGSPVFSPTQVTWSPAAKIRCRARTGLEGKKEPVNQGAKSIVPMLPTHTTYCQESLNGKSLTDFTMSQSEVDSLSALQVELFSYHIFGMAVRDPNSAFIDLQTYFDMTRATHTEKSEVAYVQVMDAKSDSKDTIIELLHDLYTKMVHNKRDYLVVAGDQKLFDIFQALKMEYGRELDWMIPMPGDWHTLMNFQKALMKPYFDTGLKSLAKAAGYPTASIKVCGQFKRTHSFLLEAWEAIYRVMISLFLKQSEQKDPLTMITEELLTHTESVDRHKLGTSIAKLNEVVTKHYHDFKKFIQNMASSDDTWRFWIQCVFQDLTAYLGLFLAIRSGDWCLRIACLKQMAPTFTAFDHHHYAKLLSQHLGDLLCMPQSVTTMFQQGAFVVSISGRAWHSVAIDEAHEMLINKSCKMSIVRPSHDYINRLIHYLPSRNKTLENLDTQLFPDKPREEKGVPLLTKDCKRELNIVAQVAAIEKHDMLKVPSNNRGLINPFTKVRATEQQASDLLNFRVIGQREFHSRISFYILREPSSKAPMRKKRLQTLSVKKANKRVSDLEKDRKLVLSCMRKKMKWSLRTGQPIETAGEQLIPLPLAMAEHGGNPLIGQKSYMTKVLEKHYKHDVFMSHYPTGWQPQCVIMEGMFLINSAPLGIHSTFSDYAMFLAERYIIPHFTRHYTSEVHLLFDNPGRLKTTPKCFEQQRRDESSKVSPGHNCEDIEGCTKLPRKWRTDLLHCRRCKRKLICFLGSYLLELVQPHLCQHQKFYVGGAFDEPLPDTTWFVQEGTTTSQPDPQFTSNAEETDTRIWLHVRKTRCNQVLVLSPDTDVYLIGLPLRCSQEKDVIVQISQHFSRELRLLSLKQLLSAMRNDPHLASIDTSMLAKVLQVLYVVTGCDYTSFFFRIGKTTYMKNFFMHAPFKSGCMSYTQGSLSDTTLSNEGHAHGFLAFLRLVGTAYYKKNAIGFDSASPEAHFQTFQTQQPSKSHLQVHSEWLEDIRQAVWDRITVEDEMLPSVEALWRHWKRSCWVLDMWGQADQNPMEVKDICSYGWKLTEDGMLCIDWDSPANIENVQQRVWLLTRGCKCKTGCKTAHCGCRKKGRNCSEGCSCQHCCNLPAPTSVDSLDDLETEENSENETEDKTCSDSSDSDSDD